jgi:hypothetical protein
VGRFDGGQLLKAKRCWHENGISTGGFSPAHRIFNKKLSAGHGEAKDEKEAKMIRTEGDHP